MSVQCSLFVVYVPTVFLYVQYGFLYLYSAHIRPGGWLVTEQIKMLETTWGTSHPGWPQKRFIRKFTVVIAKLRKNQQKLSTPKKPSENLSG